MKEKADKGMKTNDIQVKDTVLVKQRKSKKFTSRFDPVPFQVVKKKGQWLLLEETESTSQEMHLILNG